MEFVAKIWECERDKEHCVIEVAFDKSDIAAAVTVADAKIQFINVHNPGGIKRSLTVIRNRIIAGKLADAAVAALLERRIAKSGLTQVFGVKEYDKNRTDGFEHPDPYDLELTRHGAASQTIEVRSSFSYKLAPAKKIIKKLSIYGWYMSANKTHEMPRDWYWQLVYYLRPRDIPQGDWPQVDIFEDELQNGAVIGYIVGGASQDILYANGTDRDRDQDGALYRAITPICGAMDYWGMMMAMFGITKQTDSK